jgi:hypothetical protein
MRLLLCVQLDVLVNFGMLAVVLWEFESILLPHKPVDVFGLEQYGIHIDTIVQSAFAGEDMDSTAGWYPGWHPGLEGQGKSQHQQK